MRKPKPKLVTKLRSWERVFRHGGRDVTIHIRERANTAVLYADFYVRGRRYQPSTQERDVEAAASAGWRLYLKKEAETPSVALSQEYRLLSHWAADDIERAEDLGLHEDTVGAYEAAWGNIARVLGKLLEVDSQAVEIGKLTPNLMQDFVRFRRREPRRSGTETADAALVRAATAATNGRKALLVSSRTVTKELTCLRRGLERARGDEDIRRDRSLLDVIDHLLARWPDVGDASVIDQKRRAHVRDPETLRAAWELASTELRELLIVEYCTGFRADEMFRVHGSWLRRKPLAPGVPGYLDVPPDETKANDDVTIVPLITEAFEIIARRTDAGGGRLFERRDYHRDELEEISAQLGIAPRLKLKDLRRSFGTLIVKLTRNIRTAQRALRHASVVTTERHYVSLQTDGAIDAAVAIAPKMTAWLQSDSCSKPEQENKEAVQVQNISGDLVVSAVGIEPTANGLRVHTNHENTKEIPADDNRSGHVVAGDFSELRLQSQLQLARALFEACDGDLAAAVALLERVSGGAA